MSQCPSTTGQSGDGTEALGIEAGVFGQQLIKSESEIRHSRY